MDPLQNLMLQFGCNIAASTVYDWFKNKLSSKQQEKDILRNELAQMLSCNNSEVLAGKIINLLIEEQKLKMNEVGGKIIVSVKNTKEVTGLDVRRTTRILPGTEVSVSAENSESVTGVRIG